MSKNKKQITIIDIADNFIKENDTKFFRFVMNGQSWGATDKKPARVSIAMPPDICNNKNRNLGELNNWFIVCMAIPMEKFKKFIKSE